MLQSRGHWIRAIWSVRSCISVGGNAGARGKWAPTEGAWRSSFSLLWAPNSHGNRMLCNHGRRPPLSCSIEGKCFCTSVAQETLDPDAPRVDPPTTSDALEKYLKTIQVCEILEAHNWDQNTAHQLQPFIDSFTSDIVAGVVRAASSPASSLGFFNWLTRKGFEQDAVTYGTMMDVLGEAGSLDGMKHLAEEMRKSALVLDANLYDRLILWCACHGDTEGVSNLLERMKEDGLAMSASTYNSMFEVHVKDGKYEDAVTMYLQMVEERILPNVATVQLLIRCLLEAGKLEPAQEIYSSLSVLKVKPSQSVFAYLMAAHAKVGNGALLKNIGKELHNSYDRPGKAFCAALNYLQREGKGDEADAFAKEVWPELSIEERRLKAGDFGIVTILSETDMSQVGNDLVVLANKKARVSLLEMVRLIETEGLSVLEQVKVDWTADAVYKALSQFEKMNVALDFFNCLKLSPGFAHDFKNEVSMLRMLIKNLNFPAFKQLLSELLMKKRDMPLEILNTLINDCGNAKNARAAMWVYSQIKECGLQPNEETFGLLVHAFARGKNPDKASDLCSVMQDLGIKPDVDMYTAVIHSLGLAGRSDDAWSFYQKMLAAGLKPISSTYTALLNMMNLVGDTAFAIKLYKEMNDNGVAPSEATQGIMARIWEKDGNSAEAEKLEMQRKFLSSRKREDSLQHIYEVLLEGLVEQERSPSLSCLCA